jgi:signal transduction histidine kinase
MADLHPEDGRTVFVVDANMKPLDGISLIEKVHGWAAAEGKEVKCILMSALRPDAPLEAMGRVTLSEAAERLKGRCLFWRKSQQNLEAALKELDDLILQYDERLSAGLNGFAPISGPEPPGLPAPASDGDARQGVAKGLESVLEGLKRGTRAEWAVLFAMDRLDWRVDVLAGEVFLKERSSEIGAQSYLPNSPIRDIFYQKSPILFEADAGNDIPRFRNLLRFFEKTSLDSPVTRASFRSVAAIRLQLDTATKYALFIFHPSAGAFNETTVRPPLLFAAERIELLLLKGIHARQNREHQPFYLEGLARAGLRHDATAQLTDIQMKTTILAKRLPEMKTADVLQALQGIHDIAMSAHDRIERSLDRLRANPDAKNMDVRDIVEYAQRIAAGVAARWRERKRRVEFDVSYPENESLMVHGDPDALQRILENFLVNAVEHGLAFFRPRVSILVEVQKLEVGKHAFAILVHDNGPGIHGMDKRHVFDALFTTKKNGYGMGLAICREIAEEYGMSVEIQESALLAGTTFVVRIPRQMAPRFVRGRV